MRLPSLLTVALLAALLPLAGCGEPDDDSTPFPSSSTDTGTTPAEPPSDLVTTRRELRDFIQINDLPENRTVRIYQTPEQLASMLENPRFCGEDTGNLSGEEMFWYAIWNRTGLVTYYETPMYPVETYGTIDYTVQLPDDPPFLVWSGSTCLDGVTYEFHSTDWRKPPSGRGESNVDKPGAIDMRVHHIAAVHIPAGALEGDGGFEVAGNVFMVEDSGIVGDWEADTPPMLGDAYTYRAGASEWHRHSYWTLTDSSWEQQHGDTGAPGAWRYEVKLTVPAAMNTTWTVT